MSVFQSEQAMTERGTCVRGYVDIQTFFLAVVQKVQTEVERKLKVRPALIDINHNESTAGRKGRRIQRDDDEWSPPSGRDYI